MIGNHFTSRFGFTRPALANERVQTNAVSHGVLAPNAKLRAQVVPQESGPAAQQAKPPSAR